MSAVTITPTDARELCARWNKTPQQIAQQFNANADMLEAMHRHGLAAGVDSNAREGAQIERENARAMLALVAAGKVGI
jgi:hypothetical protein